MHQVDHKTVFFKDHVRFSPFKIQMRICKSFHTYIRIPFPWAVNFYYQGFLVAQIRINVHFIGKDKRMRNKKYAKILLLI